MAKYSELGNVKFTLRIVAQFLCGCELALAREWLRGSIPVWL